MTVTDNDAAVADVTVAPTSLTVTEGGSATYTIVLTADPGGPVTVGPASRLNADVTMSLRSVTFNSSNWSAAQSVTVSAGHDEDETDDKAIIAHGISGIPGVTAATSVRATVTDDDRPPVAFPITVSPRYLTIAEGGRLPTPSSSPPTRAAR